MTCFGATSLTMGRLSAVEGWHRVTTSACFFCAPSLVIRCCLTAGSRHEGAIPACFVVISLVLVRLSPVEGLRGLAMLKCFGYDSLVIVRLSAVEGRCGVEMLDSFGVDSLMTGRLSAVEGRHGVAMLDSFGADSLVIGHLSAVEGR